MGHIAFAYATLSGAEPMTSSLFSIVLPPATAVPADSALCGTTLSYDAREVTPVQLIVNGVIRGVTGGILGDSTGGVPGGGVGGVTGDAAGGPLSCEHGNWRGHWCGCM